MSIADSVLGGLPEFKFKATLFGGDAFCIEGATPLKIDGREMIFRARRAIITVTGEGLGIAELSSDTAALRGKILSVAVSEL